MGRIMNLVHHSIVIFQFIGKVANFNVLSRVYKRLLPATSSPAVAALDSTLKSADFVAYELKNHKVWSITTKIFIKINTFDKQKFFIYTLFGILPFELRLFLFSSF